MEKGLLDPYKRKIDYLRISVTDRCNLRCIYCMPREGVKLRRGSHEIISYEQILKIAKVAVSLGITKFRITGGEPLVRKGLVGLVRSLAQLEGVSDLAMTTNGTLLARYLPALVKAGLKRVNISLDTLHPLKFRQITRGANLADVLSGLEAALNYRLYPIKINTVVIRGINDDELLDLAMLTFDMPVHVRFIEFMLMAAGDFWSKEQLVTANQMKAILNNNISTRNLNEISLIEGNGPASCYQFEGALGTIGFISPLSNPFCSTCNRLRLTAEGILKPCLYPSVGVKLEQGLQGEGTEHDELVRLFKLAVSLKPKEHRLEAEFTGQPMSQIGG